MPFDPQFAAKPLAIAGAAAPGPRPFRAEPQSQDNWCWAAVTAGLIHAYHNRTVRQCEVAGYELGGDPCTTPVDGTASLDVVFRRPQVDLPGVFKDELFFADPNAAYAAICASIDAGLPVAIAIRWAGGWTYHYVCAFDYAPLNGKPALWIFDPSRAWIPEGNKRLRPLSLMSQYPAGPHATVTGAWAEAYPMAL